MKLTRLALALLAIPSAAHAQRSLFLHPESARIAPGAVLRVHLQAAGKPVPFEGTRWVFVHIGDAQENMDAPPNAADAAGIITLPCPGTGPAVVGVDLRPVIDELDAAALRAFAKAKCDEPLPAEVKGKLRLRRIESCKALLRVGDAPGAAAMSEGSQAAEIALRMDPTRAKVGSDIAFSLSLAGEDLEDARVLITSPDGKMQEVRSAEEGAGRFRITAAGSWRVEFHHLAKAAPDSGAEWVLTSGTLTFTVPEAKP